MLTQKYARGCDSDMKRTLINTYMRRRWHSGTFTMNVQVAKIIVRIFVLEIKIRSSLMMDFSQKSC